MPFDLGFDLGFEINNMHIIAIVVILVLSIGTFFYFRNKGKGGNNHVQFDETMNQEFNRQGEQCDAEKCVA